MNKKTAVVRLEGTLATGGDPIMLEPGVPVPNMSGRLAALHSAYHVIIYSPIAQSRLGLRIVVEWLRNHDLDSYAEVYEGDGIPLHDVWIDNMAESL